jgi:superfamily I DNA/RNA helicase
VKAPTHAQVVAAGDRSQAIYGWRRATDALDAFGGDRYRLTQSFRFGEVIADEANVWLELLKSDLRLVGSEKP